MSDTGTGRQREVIRYYRRLLLIIRVTGRPRRVAAMALRLWELHGDGRTVTPAGVEPRPPAVDPPPNGNRRPDPTDRPPRAP